MDKIKQLLQENGVSAEAATKICESLNAFTAQVKAQYDEAFKTRLANAKKVCMEEVNTHKVELSRRVQVFLEAKGTAIEESLAREATKRDTEAVAKLEKISALVEGIELNGQSHSELQTEVDKLRKVAKQLSEGRNQAIRKAHNLQGISERLIKRTRQLEIALTEQTKKPTNHQRLDENRSGAKPRTTRPTIRENTERQPARRAAGPDRVASSMMAPQTPEDIASTLDEEI